MKHSLPFFNWSLKKALDTETDSLVKARIRIIYTVILFSLLKAAIVVGIGAAYGQWLQVTRALAGLVIYIALFKVLLSMPSRLKTIAHIMLVTGIFVIWSNIFVYAHSINLVTVQFVFMAMLSSFYTLGNRSGVIYSVSSILPVLLFFIFRGNVSIYFTNSPQEFASPGFEIIVFINFVSITACHYLFYEAYRVNIREKEELNQQLQLSIVDANKLASSRSNFLSTMSHELRTPLNSVIGITELLIEDKPEERQKENLKILQVSARDLLSLINNILDLNKTDAGMQVLENIPFHLAEFMQNICSGLRVKANDKQLALILDIDPALERISVISDPTRLSQLIYNLVSNAIKFTDTGGVTVKISSASKTTNGVDVLFSIIDTGIGIHPDKHETIFELFTQAEADTTRKYGGTGLGLAIVKQILALFNSSLGLESMPGRGSQFFFTIPFITAEVQEKKILATAPKADLSHLKILLAEDNEINRMLIKKQLERLHIAADIVANGKLAYETYIAGHYDAVFMDLHMPVSDGYETIKQIRALSEPEKAKVYIVAFTASITEQEEILRSGFDDFLYKPVNMNDLQDKLEKIAMRRRMELA